MLPSDLRKKKLATCCMHDGLRRSCAYAEALPATTSPLQPAGVHAVQALQHPVHERARAPAAAAGQRRHCQRV
jgi:hypothetical protein